MPEVKAQISLAVRGHEELEKLANITRKAVERLEEAGKMDLFGNLKKQVDELSRSFGKEGFAESIRNVREHLKSMRDYFRAVGREDTVRVIDRSLSNIQSALRAGALNASDFAKEMAVVQRTLEGLRPAQVERIGSFIEKVKSGSKDWREELEKIKNYAGSMKGEFEALGLAKPFEELTGALKTLSEVKIKGPVPELLSKQTGTLAERVRGMKERLGENAPPEIFDVEKLLKEISEQNLAELSGAAARRYSRELKKYTRLISPYFAAAGMPDLEKALKGYAGGIAGLTEKEEVSPEEKEKLRGAVETIDSVLGQFGERLMKWDPFQMARAKIEPLAARLAPFEQEFVGYKEKKEKIPEGLVKKYERESEAVVTKINSLMDSESKRISKEIDYVKSDIQRLESLDSLSKKEKALLEARRATLANLEREFSAVRTEGAARILEIRRRQAEIMGGGGAPPEGGGAGGEGGGAGFLRQISRMPVIGPLAGIALGYFSMRFLLNQLQRAVQVWEQTNILETRYRARFRTGEMPLDYRTLTGLGYGPLEAQRAYLQYISIAAEGLPAQAERWGIPFQRLMRATREYGLEPQEVLQLGVLRRYGAFKGGGTEEDIIRRLATILENAMGERGLGRLPEQINALVAYSQAMLRYTAELTTGGVPGILGFLAGIGKPGYLGMGGVEVALGIQGAITQPRTPGMESLILRALGVGEGTPWAVAKLIQSTGLAGINAVLAGVPIREAAGWGGKGPITGMDVFRRIFSYFQGFVSQVFGQIRPDIREALSATLTGQAFNISPAKALDIIHRWEEIQKLPAKEQEKAIKELGKKLKETPRSPLVSLAEKRNATLEELYREIGGKIGPTWIRLQIDLINLISKIEDSVSQAISRIMPSEKYREKFFEEYSKAGNRENFVVNLQKRKEEDIQKLGTTKSKEEKKMLQEDIDYINYVLKHFHELKETFKTGVHARKIGLSTAQEIEAKAEGIPTYKEPAGPPAPQEYESEESILRRYSEGKRKVKVVGGRAVLVYSDEHEELQRKKPKPEVKVPQYEEPAGPPAPYTEPGLQIEMPIHRKSIESLMQNKEAHQLKANVPHLDTSSVQNALNQLADTLKQHKDTVRDTTRELSSLLEDLKRQRTGGTLFQQQHVEQSPTSSHIARR